MIATLVSLASSVGLIWAVLEVFTEYQANPGAGPLAAVRRAAAKYGIAI